MSKTIKPLGGRVLVLLDDIVESTSKIAKTADQLREEKRARNLTEGTVVSIGVDLSILKDQELQHSLKIGSRVGFAEGTGKHIVIRDKDHLVLELSDLLYVEEDESSLHLV
ncbi:MAG: hypothetical protein PF569_01450 [Candidatus Woesearchaeota archaeon]|jgi:co-chaperonin GroES (HSP10)|nr:hypothetical protein [Candidatus Woesearchaeota archaeon]